MMQTLELFSGTASFSNVAKELGHKTFTVENDATHLPDLVADVRSLNASMLPYPVDILWASPPCQGFSVMNIGRNWNYDNTPKTDTARLAMELVQTTLRLIEEVNPTWWFIENPMGKLRKMPFMQGLTRHTISYCQYGDTRQKPTDIWTNASWWHPKPICKRGGPCHEAAPRGSNAGTQRIKGAKNRSRIPADLFKELFSQCAIIG